MERRRSKLRPTAGCIVFAVKPAEEPGNTDPGTAPNDPNKPSAPGPSDSAKTPTSAPKASEVTGLRAVKNETKSITLTWDSMSGAVYEVRRYDRSKKKWITQKSNIKTPGFTDKKCKPGRHYKYVVACTNQAAVSKQLDTATKPKKLVIRSVKKSGKAIFLTWKRSARIPVRNRIRKRRKTEHPAQ
ncbi:MAG: fibronectin type III domain-containing protein [Eubacterium sp.]|nr:fibronectin type III domain-containing protein [Eubacterium sp.]